MMSSDAFPSWEHPLEGGINNNHHNSEDARFMNGSHLDRSLKEKKRQPSVKLKDPPIGSLYPQADRGHRRLSSEGIKSSGAGNAAIMSASTRGEMPRKLPPNPHNRRKSDGDPLLMYDKGGKEATFIVDSIPLSPARMASMKQAHPDQTRGDSTTCSETKSVSDASSSLQSPTETSRESSSAASLVPDQDAFHEMNPDVSGLGYSRRTQDHKDTAPTTRYAGSRHTRKDRDARRYDHSPRRNEADPPPPLSPYQDHSQTDRYRHDGPPNEADGFHDSRHSRNRFHDSRSQFDEHQDGRVYDRGGGGGEYNGGRYQRRYSQRGAGPRQEYHHQDGSRYDDDNASRVSRSSRYHHAGDRSVASRGYPGEGGRYDHHHHHQDRYDSRRQQHDDDMSQVSRGSRYHAGDRSVVSRYQTDRSIAAGGRSVVSRLDDDLGSRHSTMSYSHMSRYEMDKPTRYHNDRPQRSYYDDEASRSSARYQQHQGHQHRGGHHYEDRSRRSHYERDDASHSRYPEDRHREDPYAGGRHSRPDEHRQVRYREDPYAGSRHSRSDYHDPHAGNSIRPDHYDGPGHYDGPPRQPEDPYADPRYSRHHEDYDKEDAYGGHRDDHHGGSRHSRRPEDDRYSSSRHSRRPEDYSEDRRRDDRYAGSRHSRREEYPRQHEDRRYEGRRGYGEDDYGSRHAEDGQGNERPSGVSPFASAASSDGKDEAPEREVHIDIGFGTKARLRRTKETMDAIARDFYAPCVCVACSTDLFCIADVKFIVCPKCKTISPADAAATGEGGTATSFNGSPIERRDVGLGFTYDTLYKMQSDVARERDGRRKVAF